MFSGTMKTVMIDMDPCRPRFSPSKSRNSGEELVGRWLTFSRKELRADIEFTSIHSTCSDEDVILVDYAWKFFYLYDAETTEGFASSRLNRSYR